MPLSSDDAAELAAELLGDTAEPALAREIAREAGGHPLFVLALSQGARHAQDGGQRSAGGHVRLEDALRAQVERADASARRLLTLLVVSGAPLSERAAAHAAGLDAKGFAASSSLLTSLRLARSAAGRDAGRIEPYHDRVRETLLEALGAEERRACHASLVSALEATGEAKHDLPRLVRHLEGAGELERGARLAMTAAARASDALAFDQAAELHRAALRLGRLDRDETLEQRSRLAVALTNAGRSAEAADAHLAAAELSDAGRGLEHQRLAAELLLESGHFARGAEVLTEVLSGVGEEFPATPGLALLELIFERLRSRFRGIDYDARAEADVPPDRLVRLDIYHAVSAALSLVDMLRAAYFQEKSLALALETGEPRRLARSLILEAIHVGATGGRALERGRAMLEAARRIAESEHDAYLRHACELCAGFLDYHAGAFRSAGAHLTAAALGFEADTLGTHRDRSICRTFALVMLRLRGRLGELQSGFDAFLRDASQRGDRFTEAGLRLNLNVVWLARDQPGEARESLGFSGWIPPQGYSHTQDWYQAQSFAELDLYCGDAELGLLRFERFLEDRGRAYIFRVRMQRALRNWAHGRLLLASVDAGAERGAAHAGVARLVRALANEGAPFARCWSLLLRAGVEHQRGELDAVVRTLGIVAEHAALHELDQCAAAARFRLGRLIGGEQGAALARGARDFAVGEGIVQPERLFDVWCPGFGRRG